MKDITTPPWTVPSQLIGREAVLNGVVILATVGKERELVADFRNNRIPLIAQKANCALAGKAPAMAKALLDLEREIGDLPNSPTADRIYSIVQKTLTSIRITPPDDQE